MSAPEGLGPMRLGGLVGEGAASVMRTFWVGRAGAFVALAAALGALRRAQTVATPVLGVVLAAAALLSVAAASGRPIDLVSVMRRINGRRDSRAAMVVLVVGVSAMVLFAVLGRLLDAPGSFLALLALAVVSAGLGRTVRLSIAVSLALLGVALIDRRPGLTLVALWAGAAIVALGAEEHARMGLAPRLGGDARRASPWPVVARLLVVAVVAVIAASTLSDRLPDPGFDAERSAASRYRSTGRTGDAGLGASNLFSDSMDTGSRFVPGNNVVLRVRASRPELWRGQTFDTWDGRAWTSSARGVRLRPSTRLSPPLVEGDVDATSAVGRFERVDQVVEVVSGESNVVVGANRVTAVDFPSRTAGAAYDGSVRTPALGPGERYRVVSERVRVTPELLRRHDPLDVALSPSFAARYLQVPPSTTGRVKRLAQQIAGSQTSAYDKVQALERWMGDNTRYSLDIPRLPFRADAVDQFLVVDKVGFCQQIASALAVMLRLQGVPARVASGFAEGKWNRGRGVFDLRASDAHAWVEVWFPGLGWQGFDPTAEVPLAGEEWILPDPPAWHAWMRGALGVAVVVAALTLAAWLVRSVGRWQTERRRRPAHVVLWQELEREGRRRGRPRHANETVGEYAVALRSTILPDDRVLTLARRIEAASFAAPATAEGLDLGSSRALLRELRRHHRPPRPWRRAHGT